MSGFFIASLFFDALWSNLRNNLPPIRSQFWRQALQNGVSEVADDKKARWYFDVWSQIVKTELNNER